jgi:vancomycin permeability regulator SanA
LAGLYNIEARCAKVGDNVQPERIKAQLREVRARAESDDE